MNEGKKKFEEQLMRNFKESQDRAKVLKQGGKLVPALSPNQPTLEMLQHMEQLGVWQTSCGCWLTNAFDVCKHRQKTWAVILGWYS